MFPGVDRNKVYKLILHLIGGYDKKSNTVEVDFATEQERDTSFDAISKMDSYGLITIDNLNVIVNMRNVSFVEKSMGYV